MKRWMRALAMVLLLCLALAPETASAKKPKPTPTPAPRDITTEVVEDVPETIQALLDLAYSEWENLGGSVLKKSNKYTKWRNNYEWGWCGGFLTWCMLEVGVPQTVWTQIEEGEVEGIVHVKEAGVGKILTGYVKMHRTTMMPQKGFLVVYGKRGSGGTVHIGLVWDVEDLGGGRYRLTTIEGNMSNTVRMYVRDYDMNAEKTHNLSEIPAADRDREENRMFSYKVASKTWYINVFLMPWVPEGMSGDALPLATPVP